MQRPIILEADKPLSQSLIWQIQRDYFLQAGMTPWQQEIIPATISSNPVMARAISDLLLGYLRDCAAAVADGSLTLHPDQPLYVIELGAGSGRLAHHLLHHFFPRLLASPLAHLPVTYVMTDFVPAVVDFWRRHPRFQPWVAAGQLDFGVWDGMAQRPLHLTHANRTLTPDRVQNPLALIANYFFDSIPQDSFVIADGVLHQNLLTLTSERPEPNLADPTLWQRLRFAYEPIPIAKPHYAVAAYNELLDAYEAAFPDTTITFPNVGLDCVRYWRQFGDGRLLLLSSDRGHTLPEAMIGQPPPLPNLHGSFSMMVNYHAIGQYVAAQGGLALHAPHYQNNIQQVAYGLGALPNQGAETALAFQTAVIDRGPDDWFGVQQLAVQAEAMALPDLLSLLRLSGGDGNLLRQVASPLRRALETADPSWYPDVIDLLQTIAAHHLPLTASDPVEQLIADLLAMLENDDHA